MQIEPLADLLGVHLGPIRDRFVADFPGVEQHPPVPDIVADPGMAGLALRVVSAPELPRTWLVSADGSHLVQFQANRVGVNWRRQDDESYPHYESIRPLLVSTWERVSEALSEVGVNPMVPTMCELVYLNPIDSGHGWDDFGDLGAVLAPWSGETSDGFLPPEAAVRTSMMYPLPDEAGWLHVETNPARRLADGRPALMLQMRAVGAPFEKTLEGALRFLDLGHEWVIRGFTSVTTPAMHQIWERET